MNAQERLIEYESMLHVSVQRVGRAVRNMRQEMGGYPSSTPGNGSPGAGKGGGSVVSIADDLDPVDPDGVDVPVTSVEAQVLFGRDDAAVALGRLQRAARAAADGAAVLLVDVGFHDPGPDCSENAGADRVTVLAYRRLLMLRPHHRGLVARRVLDQLEQPVSDVFHLCQTWGYDTKRPTVSKDRAELLAVDLTEMWCTSHLRVGEKRVRDRGELCQWCRKFRDAEGFVPPRELVRLHVEHRRVYEHQIVPFRQAHRSRQQLHQQRRIQ